MKLHPFSTPTHAAVGAFIYSRYLCFVILSIQSLVMKGCYNRLSFYIYTAHYQPFEGSFIVKVLRHFGRAWPYNCLFFHCWLLTLCHFIPGFILLCDYCCFAIQLSVAVLLSVHYLHIVDAPFLCKKCISHFS